MKVDFDYNPTKNLILKETRGIGFDEIIEAINSKGLVKDSDHFNKTKYPNQRIYIVKIKNKIYFVPYVFDKKRNLFFLKTIYPSSKLSKRLFKI